MFRDFSLILAIGRVVVVVLIDDSDTLRFSLGISNDIEEYGDMFAIRSCEGIVRLPIETSDHQSLIGGWQETLRREAEVYKTLSREPLIR